jgi:hypothetical protein
MPALRRDFGNPNLARSCSAVHPSQLGSSGLLHYLLLAYFYLKVMAHKNRCDVTRDHAGFAHSGSYETWELEGQAHHQNESENDAKRGPEGHVGPRANRSQA